jgi:hypothetical protein
MQASADSVRTHGHGALHPTVTAFASAPYSTVTVFARLRGWSTSRPRRRAIS